MFFYQDGKCPGAPPTLHTYFTGAASPVCFVAVVCNNNSRSGSTSAMESERVIHRDSDQAKMAIELFEALHSPQPSARASELVMRMKGPGCGVFQFTFGRKHYEAGSGRQDLATAAYWFRLGAHDGHSLSMLALSVVYYAGHGVKQDVVQSMDWLSRLAEKGCVRWKEASDDYRRSGVFPESLLREWLVLSRFHITGTPLS